MCEAFWKEGYMVTSFMAFVKNQLFLILDTIRSLYYKRNTIICLTLSCNVSVILNSTLMINVCDTIHL